MLKTHTTAFIYFSPFVFIIKDIDCYKRGTYLYTHARKGACSLGHKKEIVESKIFGF